MPDGKKRDRVSHCTFTRERDDINSKILNRNNFAFKKSCFAGSRQLDIATGFTCTCAKFNNYNICIMHFIRCFELRVINK